MIESDDDEDNDDDDNDFDEEKNIDIDYSETYPSTSAECESSSHDKAIQVFIPDIRLKTKTRRIQTGKSQIGFRTVDANVQCSEINYCLKCKQYNGEEEITEIKNSYMHTEIQKDTCNIKDMELEDESSDDENYDYRDVDSDFNASDFDSSEVDEESDEDETCNYRLDNTDNPLEEKYYVVSESALAQLLSVCNICNGNSVPLVEHSKGAMISTVSTCGNGHINRWQSQSTHKKMPWFHLHLASAMLLSGNSISKVLTLFNHLKVLVPSSRTISRLQSSYSIPAVIDEFSLQQADYFDDMRRK